MITVEQAEQLIFEHTLNLGHEIIDIENAKHRLLQEDLIADRDFPPFHRVTMDGIAITWNKPPLNEYYEIAGIQAAGQAPLSVTKQNQCLEVMTGAVLPTNADTVIPYEHLEKNGTSYKVIQNAEKGQNIHRQGSDRSKGSIIVSKSSLLGSPEIGIAATVGKPRLKVMSLPKIAIVSTGDELVPVGHTPLPHQIRSSNAATMAHALDRWKIVPTRLHLTDDLEGTIARLRNLLNEYEILILSGGVSKGKFDHIPAALEALKVRKCFHRIQQRPGKPFWFGSHPKGCKVFAFPGNPVSSFMCFNRYFKPWLDRELGFPQTRLWGQLQADIKFQPDLTYFAQVRLEQDKGLCQAWPIEGHGSGDLANLVDADAFMELPRGSNHFKAGQKFALFPYRDR